jgi:hypothetical protein
MDRFEQRLDLRPAHCREHAAPACQPSRRLSIRRAGLRRRGSAAYTAAMLDTALLRASWRSWLASDFRRVGPWWLQLVWTFVFCVVLALGFTVLGFAAYGRGEGAWRNLPGWWHWFRLNLVMCLIIGFLIHGLLEIGARWLGEADLRALAGWKRVAFYSGIPMLGVAIGWPLGFWLLRGTSSWRRLPSEARR